jgi:proline-specific peptidase
MPYITANGIEQYYEISGQGTPLVLVHGGFANHKMWDHQVAFFADRFQVICYDLRGHGLTGETSQDMYTIDLFAEDLKALLDILDLDQVILCGLSLGGMIAQAFSVRHKDRLKALILADTAVSVRLTLSDKFQRYILAPKWLMLVIIRWMTVPSFVNFSFKAAQWTRSSEWFGADPETMEYVRKTMLEVTTEEYLKIYAAIYEFDLLDLSRITVPTLVLNGENESRAVFRHTEEMLKLIPDIMTHVVEGAGHTSNMENPTRFNALLSEFMSRFNGSG